MERRDRAPGDPRDRVTGASWRAWECRWQPARTLRGRTRGRDSEPQQLLTSGGGQMPLLRPRTRLGAQRPGGAHTRGARPRGPSPGARSALLCAPGPRGLGRSARLLSVLASPAHSEQVKELGTPRTTPVREERRGRSGRMGLILVFIPLGAAPRGRGGGSLPFPSS